MWRDWRRSRRNIRKRVSENYIVRILAVLDKRTGQRILRAISDAREYENDPDWVKLFYRLRMGLRLKSNPKRCPTGQRRYPARFPADCSGSGNMGVAPFPKLMNASLPFYCCSAPVHPIPAAEEKFRRPHGVKRARRPLKKKFLKKALRKRARVCILIAVTRARPRLGKGRSLECRRWIRNF